LWQTEAIPEAGIPAMRMSDGSYGFMHKSAYSITNYDLHEAQMAFGELDVLFMSRGFHQVAYLVLAVFNGVPASCFPASTGLGSSFDIGLVHKVGEALADEARAKGYFLPK
jgi:hypothetical protein